jgi:ribosome-binding protein aMBF1 (putative translation factor)
MIKTDKEYRECLQKLEQDLQVIEKTKEQLKAEGLTPGEIQTALQPSWAFYEQLKDEVTWYERVKRREFAPIDNLTDLGRILIALRITNGISQRALADALGVDESQISRDERNEYHGITIDRAQRILDALGEKLVTTVQERPFKRSQRLAV